MSEHDWELDFEEFDWGATDDASDADADDSELRELFSTFDGVRVDDDAHEKVLKAVLSDGNSNGRVRAREPKHLRRRRSAVARRGRRLRVVVAAACVFAVLLGVASWFVPLTTVTVVQDELNVELGVNVYGVTVSATADGELSKKVVDSASPANRKVGDALEELLVEYDRRQAQGTSSAQSSEPTVDVRAAMGFGGDAVRTEVERAVKGRASVERDDGQSAQSSNESSQEQGRPAQEEGLLTQDETQRMQEQGQTMQEKGSQDSHAVDSGEGMSDGIPRDQSYDGGQMPVQGGDSHSSVSGPESIFSGQSQGGEGRPSGMGGPALSDGR